MKFSPTMIALEVKRGIDQDSIVQKEYDPLEKIDLNSVVGKGTNWDFE